MQVHELDGLTLLLGGAAEGFTLLLDGAVDVDNVNMMTSMSMMSSCRKYHGCARLWMEVT